MNIHPVVLVIAALACALLALALWLFSRARQQQARQSIAGHMQRSRDIQRDLLAPSAAAPMPGMAADPRASAALPAALTPSASASARQWLYDHLGYGAWGITPRGLAMIAAVGVVLAMLIAMQAGALLGLMVLAVYALLTWFGIWHRVSKRRAKMLSLLPGFLDNMVRLISIGNSPHAAFQFASGNVPEPLGSALQHVNASLSVSPDLGQAMTQLERTWKLAEFGLLAAVFRMSTRYGGRVDQVLERVSAYIRDRQSAERELHSLSTEVRLSAWILALLPIIVGSLIMLLNQGYFLRLWQDSTGQKMIFIAAGLEVFGSFLLYRLARLK
ncbi:MULTISPECIES: type II secretion system F family protein [Comamonas]|uniref:Type II secretion system F family protein n=1 Tax=Comamonas squillarum TaxID=2977320 RepID=A0ABY6A069_9BURK|nr:MULTISPECIES: type II secretion system F family protein [Comamonas]PWB20981.1 secretion system protein [Comamonas sp. JNW]UXC19658.1 type II secretion system F family protein [Comamonas sp. PR12]